LQKAIIASPFVTTAIVAIATLASTWDERCDQPLHELVIADTIAFTLCGVGLVWMFSARVRKRREALMCILMWSICCLGWAIFGTVCLQRANECRLEVPHLYALAAWLKVSLFVCGGLVICLTGCCRTETCLDGGLDESLGEEGSELFRPQKLDEQC
jgi:hypothetical protein